MPPKAADKKPAAKAPAAKAPAEKKDAGKKTAASGDKKKRTKARKETYSSYIYKGEPIPPRRVACFAAAPCLLSTVRLTPATQFSSRSTLTLVSPTALCPS